MPALLGEWPKDAPIQLRSGPETIKGGLSEGRAEQLCRTYLGLGDRGALRLSTAYLSDSDFAFMAPEGVAVWIAQAVGVVIASSAVRDGEPDPPKPSAFSRLYLAIHAATGLPIECFSPPRRAWWLEYRGLVGRKHESFLRECGVLFEQPHEPPRVSLVDALAKTGGRAESGAQLVARYVLYSNSHQGRAIERVEGFDLVPVATRRPAWLIVQEGVEGRGMSGPAPHPGTQPAQREPAKVVMRCTTVVDAQTGKVLEAGGYGGPP
jgi:hypothetical protein